MTRGAAQSKRNGVDRTVGQSQGQTHVVGQQFLRTLRWPQSADRSNLTKGQKSRAAIP